MNGSAWHGKVREGMHIFPVNEGNGAYTKLIVTDGDHTNPSIERVYEIGLLNDTDGEIFREVIYEFEKQSRWNISRETFENYFRNEPVRLITKEDWDNYREFRQKRERSKSEGTQRDASELQNEGRSGGNDSESSNPNIKHSIGTANLKGARNGKLVGNDGNVYPEAESEAIQRAENAYRITLSDDQDTGIIIIKKEVQTRFRT